MKLAQLVLGQREFCSKEQIIASVKSSKFYMDDLELRAGEALLIFDTSKQHTWLVFTKLRFYVVLDDLRNEEPRVQWSTEPFPEILNTTDKSERVGYIHFNDRPRGWLYSKRLFGSMPIVDQVSHMISSVR